MQAADSLQISLKNVFLSQEIGMAAQLPDDLIVEILSMLPAKSLLRCQLVCKSWLYLITSTKFKLMHLHNFNQLNPRYLVRRWYDGKELYNVHLDDEALTIDHAVEFPFDRSCVNYCFRIVGCCNGVVCLSDDDGDSSTLDMITLWNPSIRRKLTLTGRPSFYPIKFKSFVVLGFGYDRMSDDYKVVSLNYTCWVKPQVEVYTVKTGIWRKVMFPDDLSCFFILPTWSQVFFNGTVHWIACDLTTTTGVSRNSIMTFDIRTEVFGEIQLPECLAKKITTAMSQVVSVVGESLAVLYSTRLNMFTLDIGSAYMVWVMKEYRNPTSWTMIYNMRHPDIDMGKPLQLRNNGDMIMESMDGDIIIHNHNVDNYVYAPSIWTDDHLECGTYVDKFQESLALLDVGHSVPNEEAMNAALMMIEKQEKCVKLCKNSPK